MIHVVSYLLEGSGTVPAFITDGGYFLKNEELIGISVDSSKRYLPSTVNILTREQLTEWITGMCMAPGQSILSSETAKDVIDSFLADRGLSDYA